MAWTDERNRSIGGVENDMSDIGRTPSIGMLEEAGQAALVNLALGKPALQSSTGIFSPAPDAADDARGAVSGTTSGGCGFHTAEEDGPWWQVDLEEPSVIREVVVFNRVDQEALKDRAVPLEISFSDDGIVFKPVHLQQEVFGGLGGAPLRWSTDGTPVARFVRLTTRKVTWLHLDEVEIYGAPARGMGQASVGGMGQASALGSATVRAAALHDHDAATKADLLPSLPIEPAMPTATDGHEATMAPAATADQGLELLGNDAPRELGEPEAVRTPFWDGAVTSRPVGPEAAQATTPEPAADSFLAKLRRVLFGS